MVSRYFDIFQGFPTTVDHRSQGLLVINFTHFDSFISQCVHEILHFVTLVTLGLVDRDASGRAGKVAHIIPEFPAVHVHSILPFIVFD